MDVLESIQRLPPTLTLLVFGLVAYSLYKFVASLSERSKQRLLRQGTLPAVRLRQLDPILGLDLFQKNIQSLRSHTLLESGKQRFDEYGVHTFQLNSLGRQPFITREPEILKTIQATDHKIWSLGQRRITSFRPFLGIGIFTSDGAEWQHSREMIRPNFVRSQVADLNMFESHIQDMMKLIPKDGSTVDLSELFFLLTMDSATDFLFGHSTGALTKGTADGFALRFQRGQESMANKTRYGGFFGLFKLLGIIEDNHFEADRKFVHDFVDTFVHAGLKNRQQLLAEKKGGDESGRYIFIDELIRRTSDPVRIRSELLNVLLAGRDTTASLLSNAWFVLAKRPDIWQKLQDEIAFLKGNPPTFEQTKDMTYMKAFLNESLRLHPVVPVNSRTPTEDTTLPVGGGPDGKSPLFVPKGGVVAWSVYAMHRRKDFYGEDAEEFKPERWIDDPVSGRKALRPTWQYLPFNGGARICLGQQFALTEASYTTIRLMQAFSGIESRNPGPWQELISLTCTSLDGAKVSLTPRQKA